MDSRARRLALYEEVRRRHAGGEPLLAIARAMGLARGTVRKYAEAPDFPERASRRSGASIIDPHLPHLRARLAEGCADAATLWREVKARGYVGGARQVRRWLTGRRTEPARTAPRRWRGPAPDAPDPVRPASIPLPAPRQLAWLLAQPLAALTQADAAVIARVEQDAEAATVVGIARGFVSLVHASNAGNKVEPAVAEAGLKAWLSNARTCGVRAMETFATGRATEGGAIRAALTTPWSNGQTEGQVNRLKLIKRQMFGKAGFDLLRRRVLLAA